MFSTPLPRVGRTDQSLSPPAEVHQRAIAGNAGGPSEYWLAGTVAWRQIGANHL